MGFPFSKIEIEWLLSTTTTKISFIGRGLEKQTSTEVTQACGYDDRSVSLPQHPPSTKSWTGRAGHRFKTVLTFNSRLQIDAKVAFIHLLIAKDKNSTGARVQ